MITLNRISKRYRGFGGANDAVRAIDATIRTGAITAVLGPNGSGKTTLLRMLAGQIAPTDGSISIAGRPVSTDARIPYFAVAHDGNNFGEVTMRDCLRMARTRPGWDDAMFERLAERFELPKRRRSLSKLSSGQQAGFAISCALASGAPIIVIDEAHAGMDVPKRLALYEELVRANAEDGRTVIIASHNVGELERIVEDVIVVKDGGLVESTTVESLGTRYARLIGPTDAVGRAVGRRPIVARRELGSSLEVTVDVSDSPLDPAPDGVVVTPVDFQDAFVATIEDGGAMPMKGAS